MVPEAVKVGAEKALVNFGGYDKTNKANDKFEAAYAAKSYNVTVDKEKCSGWFLPASGQWLAVVYGLCGAAYPDKAQGTWWRNGKDGTDNKVHLWGEDGFTDKAKVLGANSDYAHEIINAKLQAAAGLNASAGFDPIETGSGPNKWVNYWTSSECVKTEKNGKTNTDSAIRMNFGVNEKKETKYSSIKTDNKIKDNKDSKFRVRAFLAF